MSDLVLLLEALANALQFVAGAFAVVVIAIEAHRRDKRDNIHI